MFWVLNYGTFRLGFLCFGILLYILVVVASLLHVTVYIPLQWILAYSYVLSIKLWYVSARVPVLFHVIVYILASVASLLHCIHITVAVTGITCTFFHHLSGGWKDRLPSWELSLGQRVCWLSDFCTLCINLFIFIFIYFLLFLEWKDQLSSWEFSFEQRVCWPNIFFHLFYIFIYLFIILLY